MLFSKHINLLTRYAFLTQRESMHATCSAQESLVFIKRNTNMLKVTKVKKLLFKKTSEEKIYQKN